MTFLEYFDRIWIINLPDRTDRRRDMLAELESHQLSLIPNRFEFFPAIRSLEAGNFETPGTQGCFLSHRQALMQAMQEDAKRVLILEDDLQLSPRFQIDQSRLVQRLAEENWAFAYFGNLKYPLSDEPIQIQSMQESLIGCHFYAVNGWVLPELLEFLQPIPSRPQGHPIAGGVPIDGALELFRKAHPEWNSFMAYPNLGHQRSTRSDISPKWFDRIPVVNRGIELLRRTRRWLRKG